ncbi:MULTISPECIES: DUF3107 domain-containing protein [unclassified Schaalia]|uniref:DUF3107 domain-containing protein n=1 Tax=unclassified Schaalia TaxID=2691889 RepID=UPI001E554CF2|nr:MULTISPECIES: DUF3107 domain-containing protein [unclassified Schaalia]MCD4549088.1 DUF3107 domain-containing protein [Schaalia sp. lx-260]MCD4557276.1 DUF3107 domain-containing protein [Schaalia sp. lx-100]
MNITVGLRAVPREITLDVDMTHDDLFHAVDAALQSGVSLRLSDTRGEKFLFPAQSIGYVQVAAQQKHRVGFSIQ